MTSVRGRPDRSARAAALLAALAALAAGARAQLFSSIDGSQNSLLNPSRGAAGTTFVRRAGLHSFADGVSAVRDGPNPRHVSNRLFARGPFRYNGHEVAFMAAAWGQLIGA